ncbi:hypothetical protein AB1Y20_007964 [Prymnesium parvum]|uniref:Uncharacterized protein n=1 Tax=Prymnesium parvum TaxID=97485 RepID=A0AB34IVS6_PRYPA
MKRLYHWFMDDTPPSPSRGLETRNDEESSPSLFGSFSKSFSDSFTHMWDAALSAQVDRMLSSVGRYMSNSLVDPYAPSFVNSIYETVWHELWADIQHELKVSVMESLTYGDEEDRLFREFRLKGWPTSGPPFWPKGSMCPKGYTWFRANVLYSVLPADGTTWSVLRTPTGFIVFCIGMTSAYAANVWLFVILFFLIDKRDEFQLVNFILKFKGFQAVSALISAASASSAMYHCTVVSNGVTCPVEAPGNYHMFVYAAVMEPVRIVLVWVAFSLLWFGYAHGGKEEILALENVRQDMADGKLDGVRDLKALREQDTELDRHEAEASAEYEIDAAVQRARKKFSTFRRTGGFLPYFLVYDLLAAAYVAWCYGLDLLTNGFTPYDPNTAWKLWTTIFFAKNQYALMAFPFLIFSMPVIGRALTKTKTTGYDKRGMLCAGLSSGQIKKVFNDRQESKSAAASHSRRHEEELH